MPIQNDHESNANRRLRIIILSMSAEVRMKSKRSNANAEVQYAVDKMASIKDIQGPSVWIFVEESARHEERLSVLLQVRVFDQIVFKIGSYCWVKPTTFYVCLEDAVCGNSPEPLRLAKGL